MDGIKSHESGDEGTGEDIDIGRRVVDVLNKVERAGSFSMAHKIKNYVSPGLTIQGLGKIGFPLVASQAKDIVSICSKGKLSDKAMWQMDTLSFFFSNPAWNEMLQNAVPHIQLGLGVTDISIKLDKLRIYEAGGFCKFPKNVEKSSNILGQLVVLLPSEFEGGQLIITREGDYVVYDCSSDRNILCFAFYGDCECEIKTITSGYRLEVVYDIIFSGKSAPPTPPSNEVLASLRDVLRDWTEKGKPSTVVIPLGYIPKPLSLLTLNPSDQAKVTLLKNSVLGGMCKLALGITNVEDENECHLDGASQDYRTFNDFNFIVSNMVNLDGVKLDGPFTSNSEELQSGKTAAIIIWQTESTWAEKLHKDYYATIEEFKNLIGVKSQQKINAIGRVIVKCSPASKLGALVELNLIEKIPLVVAEVLAGFTPVLRGRQSFKSQGAAVISKLVEFYCSHLGSFDETFLAHILTLMSIVEEKGDLIANTRLFSCAATIPQMALICITKFSHEQNVEILLPVLERTTFTKNGQFLFEAWPDPLLVKNYELIRPFLQLTVGKVAPNEQKTYLLHMFKLAYMANDTATLTNLSLSLSCQYSREHTKLFLNLLEGLWKWTEDKQKLTESSWFCDMHSTLYTNVMSWFMEVNKPTAIWNLMSYCECKCEDCEAFAKFCNNSEKEFRLTAPASRRAHIEKQIKDLKIDVLVSTSPEGLFKTRRLTCTKKEEECKSKVDELKQVFKTLNEIIPNSQGGTSELFEWTLLSASVEKIFSENNLENHTVLATDTLTGLLNSVKNLPEQKKLCAPYANKLVDIYCTKRELQYESNMVRILKALELLGDASVVNKFLACGSATLRSSKVVRSLALVCAAVNWECIETVLKLYEKSSFEELMKFVKVAWSPTREKNLPAEHAKSFIRLAANKCSIHELNDSLVQFIQLAHTLEEDGILDQLSANYIRFAPVNYLFSLLLELCEWKGDKREDLKNFVWFTELYNILGGKAQAEYALLQCDYTENVVWKLPEKWNCECAECVDFSKFCANSSTAEYTIKSSKQSRKHIEDVIREHKLDITTTHAIGNQLVCKKRAMVNEQRMDFLNEILTGLAVMFSKHKNKRQKV